MVLHNAIFKEQFLKYQCFKMPIQTTKEPRIKKPLPKLISNDHKPQGVEVWRPAPLPFKRSLADVKKS
tara:strand:- start:2642 stop:2845 length:204 start_codon:yes stop_codon:yes gene_type:complete